MADVAISALPALTPVASTSLLAVVESSTTRRATVADVVKGGNAILKDGTVAFTADQSFGGFRATSVGTAVAGTDAPNLTQVQSLIAASISTIADWKQSVRAATTANITLSGAQTIDGVSVVAGDRVLVKNQSTGSQNGPYVVAAGAWTRATDADVNAEVTTGLAVVVEEGTANGGKIFILTTANPIVVGTTALTFTGLGTVTADGSTLTQSGSTISIATGGILNTHVNTSAAIAGTKISPNFGSQAISTTGTLALGTNPASSGDLRLPAVGSIQFRNVANSGNVLAISTGSGDDELRIGNTGALGYRLSSSSNLHAWRVGGSDMMTLNATLLTLDIGVLGLGSGFASVGKLRMQNGDAAGDGIYFRNAANNGDVRALSVSSGNILVLGDSSDTFIGVSQSANTVSFSAGGAVAAVIGSAFLSVGTSPASAGALRLANSTDVRFRNAANNNDVIALRVDSSDTVSVGDVSATGIRLTSAGVIGFRVGGVDELTINATTIDAQSNGIVTTGSISIGSGPSSAGHLRIANGDGASDGIWFRNGTNNGDVRALSMSSGNTLVVGDSSDTFIGISQSANTISFSAGGSAAAVIGSSFLSIGTTPATAGILRLPNAQAIVARNAANNANLDVIYLTGGDGILIGHSSVGSISLVNSGGTGFILSGTNAELGGGIRTLRFDSATPTSALVHVESTSTTAATGISIEFAGQDVTGTGATVGGITFVRAGNSTNGTGGELQLLSGTGATAPGKWTAKLGSTTLFQMVDLGSGREVVSLLSAVTTTEMPANTGDRVLFMAARTTAPTAAPVGGCILYTNSSGEFVTVSTDGTTLNMKLGDGSNGVVIKAGGATDPRVSLISGGTYNSSFDTGFLDFDAGSTGAATEWNLKYRGNTYVTMGRSGGVKMSVFGVTAVAQATDPGALSMSVGTADGAMDDVGASFNQTTLNNNFRELRDKYEALRTRIRNFGIAA